MDLRVAAVVSAAITAGVAWAAACGGVGCSARHAVDAADASPLVGGPDDTTAVRCDPERGAAVPRERFTRITVDAHADGPGFVDVGDVNGDGRRDLVVTTLGHVAIDGANVTVAKARVRAYLQGATLGCWQARELAAADAPLYFANEPTLADVDADGDTDVIVPSGFFVCAFDKSVGPCGALGWLENSGQGAWPRHDVVPLGDPRFYHRAVHVDFDGDGVRDLVTVGETTDGPRAMWFKGNLSPDRFARAPILIGDALGSFPVVTDVDGDGDLDVAGGEYFVKGSSFAWLEHGSGGAAAPFTRHEADDSSGRGFLLARVPDLFGDGIARFVGTNHVNGADDPAATSAVFVFDPMPDVREPWPKTVLSRGIASRPSEGQRVQGAPGVFGWGDVDGDGDVDLALAGDGDARVFWMEQTGGRSFAMHVIEESLGQASGGRVEDLDGDGANEIVFTGYEDDAVYVYTRGAK